MNYTTKITHAESILSQFVNGKKEDAVIVGLKSQGLSNSNIDAILRSAKNLFFDQYSSSILKKMEDDGALVLVNGLDNTDMEWCKKFYDYTWKKLKENEKQRIDRLVEKGTPLDDLIKEANLKLYPEKEIEQQVIQRAEKIKKDKNQGYLFIVAGILFLGIFILSLPSGRPRVLSGIAAAVLLFRGVDNLR